MTSQSLLLVEKAAEGYAVVTLNRPEAMNALSRGLCDQLDATIRALEDTAFKQKLTPRRMTIEELFVDPK